MFHRRPVLNAMTLVGLLIGLMVFYPWPKGGLVYLAIFSMLTTAVRTVVGGLCSWKALFPRSPKKGDAGTTSNRPKKEDAGSIRGKLWLVAQDAPMIILAPIVMLGISIKNIGRELDAKEDALQKRVDDSDPERNQACISIYTSNYSQVSDQQDWDASLFLVADNQFRALHRKSSTGHTSLINKLVPVAQRPVELDLLSGVTLANFGKTYQRMLRTGFEENLRWAHLGDFADLAWQSELDRIDAVIKNFGENPVGFAPGNHDKFFTGNFSWHPDWSEDEACSDRPLSHKRTNKIIHDNFYQPDWSEGEACSDRPLSHKRTNKIIHDNFYQPAWVEGISSLDDGYDFLARIVKLTKDGSIVAVFLDSSDYNITWFGVAGVLGHVSDDQAKWVIEKLSKNFPDAYVVLLAHHPLESIDSGLLGSGMKNIVNELSGRILAFVGAHTHLSQHRLTSIEIDKSIFDSKELSRYRNNPEDKSPEERIHQFIVGSTTDSPQEAAILRMRIRDGSPELRFETIPSVSQKGISPCGVPTVRAEFCKAVLGEIGDCYQSIWEKIKNKELKTVGEKCKKDKRMGNKRKENQEYAFALLTCIENQQYGRRSQQCVEIEKHLGPFCPLDDKDIYAKFDEKSEKYENRFVPDTTMQRDRSMDRIVCLSWAASILQQHKHEGWDFQDALFLSHTKLDEYPPWYFDSGSQKKR